jgi:hypothetical protein
VDDRCFEVMFYTMGYFLNIWCLGSDWEDDIASGYDVCARLCHVTPFNYISYAYIYYL